MIHMANALLALGDSAEARALHDRLAASDMTVGFVHDGDAAITAAHRSHPDVVVVGPGLAGPGAMEVLRALKSDAETADIPVFVLTEAPLAEIGGDLLEAGADDGAAWPASAALIVGRVRPLVRVATMHAELKHRGALFADLGLGAVPTVEADATEPPVLLVVGDGAAEATVAAAVAEAEVVRAPDLIEAQRMMEDRLFDACVMVPHDGEVEAHLDLCLQTRRNARLFNLPVVFAADAGLMPDPARALGMGASHALPGLEPRAELRFALLALVRRQRLRWAIRRALAQTLRPGSADTLVPEVYSAEFLNRYLGRRVSSAQEQERGFSVIGFAFAGVDTIRYEFGDDSATSLLDQIGQWLTLLVRAEDLVARLDGARFCVTLPDTPLSEAQVVMHRIAGVISNTDFAVRDVYRVVNVWPFVNATALTETDTVHTLLERAAATLGDEVSDGV